MLVIKFYRFYEIIYHSTIIFGAIGTHIHN